ncbi:sensor histidine kinase [Eionea flava]
MTLIFRKNLHGLTWFIASLCVSTLLSVLLYLSLIIQSQNESEATTKIYQQSIAASISQYEYLPALMASESLFVNALLYSSNNRLVVNQRLQFITARAGADVAYIMNRSGEVIATSNYKQPSSFLNKNYAFRPYFKESIASKTRQFYYAEGATTGIPGFFIAEPIIYNQQAIGVAVVKLSMSYWEENWKNANNTIIAADSNGIIVLSSQSQWRYKATRPLSLAEHSRISQLQQFGQRQHEHLYRHKYQLSPGFFSSLLPTATFWDVDNTIYLANRSDIPAVNWSLYHLINHHTFLYPALILFSIINIFIFLAYLFRRERRYRIASTDKTKALEALQKEELKRVMDNINVGIVLFSNEGKVVSLNAHAKLLLFKTTQAPPENTHLEDIIDISFDKIDTLLFENIASATYHETYTLHQTHDKTAIMFAVSKITAMNTRLYLMTLINIERRKSAENELVNINNSLEDIIMQRTVELKEAQATLIQKNKAAALGNMAATIVHELSQPLSAINSSVSAIDAKIIRKDWDGAKISAARLNPLSKKMHDVINLLKNFSYKDEKAQEKVCINTVVRQSIDTFRDITLDKKITLNEYYYDNSESEAALDKEAASSQQDNDAVNDYAFTLANPLKLDLVFTNIIKNAIEASEKNNQPEITIRTEKNAYSIYVHITDNGGGINPDVMSTLFTPYFTTKAVGKGLGLGLSISHEIIQEYQGKIYANNSRDGVCFTIELPRHD